MNDDRLESLLRTAGQSAGPPVEPTPGLAGRVRQLQRRRSRNRELAGGAVVGVALLGVAVYIVGWDQRSAVPPDKVVDSGGTALRLSHPTPDADALRAEIARLDDEARQRQEGVRKMIAADAARLAFSRMEPDQDQPDPLDLMRIEREKTAFLLVDRADEIGSRTQATAAAEYRRVLELFPNTQAARVAEERLKTL